MKLTTLTITMALSIPVAVTALESQATAQVTPGINPNADTPTVDTGNIDDITSDISDLTQDIDGDISNVTEDVTGEVEGVTEGLQEQAEQITEDIGFDQIDPQVEEVTGIVDGFEGALDNITGLFEDIGEDLSGIFGIFEQFGLPDFFGIFESPEEILGNGGEGGGSIAEGSQGVLGLPDPKVIEENIEQSGTSPTEEVLATMTGGGGSPVIKLDAKEIFDADLAEEVARSSALTQEGQEKLAQNVEIANQSLEASQQLAEDSENQDVSQNIMRNISVQASQRQATDTLLAIDAQLRQRDDALRNIVVSDNLRQNKRDRVAERRMDASSFNFAITHGGLIALPNLDEE